jgi:hypothetical protein
LAISSLYTKLFQSRNLVYHQLINYFGNFGDKFYFGTVLALSIVESDGYETPKQALGYSTLAYAG